MDSQKKLDFTFINYSNIKNIDKLRCSDIRQQHEHNSLKVPTDSQVS